MSRTFRIGIFEFAGLRGILLKLEVCDGSDEDTEENADEDDEEASPYGSSDPSYSSLKGPKSNMLVSNLAEPPTNSLSLEAPPENGSFSMSK